MEGIQKTMEQISLQTAKIHPIIAFVAILYLHYKLVSSSIWQLAILTLVMLAIRKISPIFWLILRSLAEFGRQYYITRIEWMKHPGELEDWNEWLKHSERSK